MSRNQRRKKRNKPGSGQNANRNANRDNTKAASAGVVRRRSSTETKSSLRTTEFFAYAGAVLAVLITALAVNEDGRGGNDPFGADSAIRYITYLTFGYVLARGLAKSGSHENRVEDDTDVDDAASTGVTRDEDVRNDDDDDSGRDGDGQAGDARVDDVPGTAVEPSDPVERPAAENVDVRP